MKLWKTRLSEYDELEVIAWEWQAADGTVQKASMSQETLVSCQRVFCNKDQEISG